jgi:hypothetical protein
MSMVKKTLYLTFSVIGVIFLSLLILFLSQRSDIKVSNITGCQSDSQLMVYCEFSKPEDIVVLPDERHLLISEFGAIVPLSPENLPGQISLFDTDMLEKKLIEITLGDNDWGEKSCKRDDLLLSPHGIDLNQRSDGRYQLAVVNHMPRETIEMFELINLHNSWSLIWRGCVDAPELGYFNDVALKGDGSFFTTHMYERGLSLLSLLYISFTKPDTGFVYQWDAGDGFTKVPNSGGSFPNGISISDDEKNLFINYVFNHRTSKLNLENLNVEAEHFSKGTPDNSSINGDYIWVATQDNTGIDLLIHCDETVVQCSLPFTIFKLRQSDLSEVAAFSFSQTQMGSVTVAVTHKDKVWLGTFHGDRMASFDNAN